MGCNGDYCEIEVEPKPCPKCGRLPVVKLNMLTAWLKCPACGRCAIGSNRREAVKNWNKQEMK